MSDYDKILDRAFDWTVSSSYYENGVDDVINVYIGPNFSTPNAVVIGRLDPDDVVNLYLHGSFEVRYADHDLGTIVHLVDPETGARIGTIASQGESLGTVNVKCFTRGARVATPGGTAAIEDLHEGDLVLTRDHGAQPIRWIGSTRLTAETLARFPDKRPVTIAAGTFGDHAETTVSPGHRILVSGWRAEALFGQAEVLATAGSLVNDTTIRHADTAEVEYFHTLFDAHELVMVDGMWSESFHPGAVSTGLDAATRDEVIELFPELETGPAATPARMTLDASDVAILVA